MSPRRHLARALPGFAVVLLLAGCDGQWVEEQIPVPPSAEARADPLLALQRLCESLGREVHRMDRLEAPAERDAVLLLPLERALHWGPDVEDLLAWVDQGGSLVVAAFGWGPAGEDLVANDDRSIEEVLARTLVLERSPLLQELGVGFDHGTNLVTTVTTDRREYALRFPSVPSLVDRDGRALTERAGDEDGADLLRFPYGAGIVTVLTSGHLFSNDLLAEEDDAAYLWRLLSEEDRRGPVWLMLEARGGFFGLLVERADLALVSLLLLVAVWLLQASTRLGPRLADPPPARRAFHEHVLASGRYLYASVGGEALLEPLRARALRRAEHVLPRPAATTDAQWADLLAARTGLDADELRRSLFPTERDGAGFLRTAQTLRRLDDLR